MVECSLAALDISVNTEGSMRPKKGIGAYNAIILRKACLFKYDSLQTTIKLLFWPPTYSTECNPK